MKLLIVRHGDPDYSIDSLTETGWIEAELLSDRLCKLDVKKFLSMRPAPARACSERRRPPSRTGRRKPF